MTAFPIVGIGASAGGLAAFTSFFAGMPSARSGMAVVLVQHLSPQHESLLSDLVRRHTAMTVLDIADGMVVEPECVYVAPPNRDLALGGGALWLSAPRARRGLPIDHFFRSLAGDQLERAIGIVLSGTGCDGTLGVRAIKGHGGMVMVQEPSSTEHDGMPRSAMATGLVDFVLRPEEMAVRILTYTARALDPARSDPPSPHDDGDRAARPAVRGGGLHEVCELLRAHTGHDFSAYKQSTLSRRIERRMAVHQIGHIQDYLRFADERTDEVDALFHDLLIGVTSFFRDPGAFAALANQVIPGLFARPGAGGTLRVWVPACSTGEEAYSIAMLLREHLEGNQQRWKIRIFATDIDARAIAYARAGVFPASVAHDISSERLERFFVEDEQAPSHRIRKHIRDLLVFSEQDVLRDPPFSRIDLICCRNLLIYLKPEAQAKVLALFHYALNPGGALFLGSSETAGEHATHFSAIDRTWKLYARAPEEVGAGHAAVSSFGATGRTALSAKRALVPEVAPAYDRLDPRTLTEQALLGHYVQVAVLVDARGDILHIVGRTGRYLEPAPGDARLNMLAMAREGLQRALTLAVHRVAQGGDSVHHAGLRVRGEGSEVLVDLTVLPVRRHRQTAGPGPLLLVLLEESPDRRGGAAVTMGATPEGDERVASLEAELRASDEYLRTTIERMEATNEALRTTGDDVQSLNEELQSANEELETSKEELQSLNEELATVNAELRAKVGTLSRANDDLNNLLASTGIGTLFVDQGLRIARFTPDVTEVINLIDGDVGRPVGHVVSNLVGYDGLVRDIGAVLDTLVPHEAEVRTTTGSWYLMRIRPYRTLENAVEGAVVTFTDISSRKAVETSLAEARGLVRGLVATVREALVVLDGGLRVVVANRTFCETFGFDPVTLEGRSWFELGHGVPDLAALIAQLQRPESMEDALEVTLASDGAGRPPRVATVRRASVEARGGVLVFVAIRELA